MDSSYAVSCANRTSILTITIESAENFTSERDADTVKKVKLSETESLFFITLIEHKTQVDYNVVMQLFRYMSLIWEDTPEYLLEIIARITTALLTRLNLPQEDVDKAVNQVKERNMPVLFENFKGFDFQAARKEGKIGTQVFQIFRKLQKGHNISQIAEALEMKKSEIRPIYKIAQKYAPDYDPEAVFTEVLAFLKETGKI